MHCLFCFCFFLNIKTFASLLLLANIKDVIFFYLLITNILHLG